ncbi:hypothetical protein [Afipia sp. DC4300-2b1]|uniref:hypothetical protein n=1 Tax=Afipia sp. DC4300-2b1 TaxID=2804672 RepID=UPI003CEF6199
MDWTSFLLLGVGALIGFGLRPPGKKESSSQVPTVSARASAVDRSNLIQAYVRELSNYLVQLNPERYYFIYNRALEEQEKLFTADKTVRDAQLLILTERYPMYENFDFVSTRPYVVYAQTLKRYDEDDIEEHFTNLVKFHSLQRAASDEWRYEMPMLSKKELDHLAGYIRQIKDGNFKERLKLAVKLFHAARQAQLSDFQLQDSEQLFENGEIAVYRVYDVAESVHGIWFKDTNEYALFSVFYGDDKTYDSFYRSDRTFEKREVLHAL